MSQLYSLLEYEVQYGESDYDFVQRLMERSGIYWFFEHENGKHRMVLIDNTGAHRQVASKAYQILPYSPFESRIDQEFIRYFNTAECIQSGKWTTNDFDFMKPALDLSVYHSQPKNTACDQLTVYEWPGNYTDP